MRATCSASRLFSAHPFKTAKRHGIARTAGKSNDAGLRAAQRWTIVVSATVITEHLPKPRSNRDCTPALSRATLEPIHFSLAPIIEHRARHLRMHCIRRNIEAMEKQPNGTSISKSKHHSNPTRQNKCISRHRINQIFESDRS
ncbi:hypothetical protein [Burkholderia mayonis]|uniref:hypothetical protein n=1 Tax=Burkholderia mayonis TaxID=1385591 RepID=UPI00131F1A70|nr:hypothetical protein [Burkholderia mayonis]